MSGGLVGLATDKSSHAATLLMAQADLGCDAPDASASATTVLFRAGRPVPMMSPIAAFGSPP